MEPNIARSSESTNVVPSSSLEFLIGKVTIGITTRNRWTELETTIHQLIRHGLQAVKVIIIDDGSSEAMAHNVCEGLKNCWILREEHSLGLVVERNRIAALCDTEYLISLDDDACFVNIDGLEHSVRMCDEDLSIAVIAFSVATADTREEKWADADRRAPYDVAGFMGGGHCCELRLFGSWKDIATICISCAKSETSLLGYSLQGRGLFFGRPSGYFIALPPGTAGKNGRLLFCAEHDPHMVSQRAKTGFNWKAVKSNSGSRLSIPAKAH